MQDHSAANLQPGTFSLEETACRLNSERPSQQIFGRTQQERERHALASTNETALQNTVQLDSSSSDVETDALKATVHDLQHRVALAEAHGAQTMCFMQAMHAWACKTAASLRTMEQVCSRAETAANTSQDEALRLQFSVTQLQAQLEATTTALEELQQQTVQNDTNPKRRKLYKSIPRVDTSGSLVKDDAAGGSQDSSQ
jgi:hypothetical protein